MLARHEYQVQDVRRTTIETGCRLFLLYKINDKFEHDLEYIQVSLPVRLSLSAHYSFIDPMIVETFKLHLLRTEICVACVLALTNKREKQNSRT